MGDLTENFSRREFECKCGCGYDEVERSLVEGLQELRDLVGLPLHVCSGCRCLVHNARVGGAKNSQHMAGKAADIACRWLTPQDLKGYALQVDVFANGGIGVYKGFLHVDVRNYPARW